MKCESQPRALIIYLSPHGTTKTAADRLAASLRRSGVSTDICSLGKGNSKNRPDELRALIPEYDLIVTASPTYFHHPPPLFLDFLESIPEASGDQAAALLATFGGVSSGVILHDLAAILHRKKYRLLGGLQVLAEHSLTFQAPVPFCPGHPDENDLAGIDQFGEEIARRMTATPPVRFLPIDFSDKPGLMRFIDSYINRLENFSWVLPSIKIDQTLCTGCGLCVEQCPTNNIRLEGGISHGTSCIHCYACVRGCPHESTRASLKPLAPVVAWLSRRFRKYEAQITRQVV